MASQEENIKQQKTIEPKELVREIESTQKSNDIGLEISDDKLECPKYIKEDSLSGYLSNKGEIEDYKRKQQIDIMRNQLLGQFDEEGNYYLSPEIIHELKNVKKEIVEQYKTYLFLHSVYPIKGYGNISFFVSISKLSTGELKSKLVLLEKIERVNGFIINTVSAVIDEYVSNPGAEYYDAMKNEFNIVKVDQRDINEGEEQDILKYSTLHKLQLSELWRKVGKQIEKIEKNVFERKLKALTSMKNNTFAKTLLEEFYKESAKIDKIFLRDSDEKYIALNALLDECFDRLRGRMPQEEKAIEDALIDAGKNAVNLQEQVVDSVKDSIYERVEQEFNNPNSRSKGKEEQEQQKQEQEQQKQHKNNRKEEYEIVGVPGGKNGNRILVPVSEIENTAEKTNEPTVIGNMATPLEQPSGINLEQNAEQNIYNPIQEYEDETPVSEYQDERSL